MKWSDGLKLIKGEGGEEIIYGRVDEYPSQSDFSEAANSLITLLTLNGQSPEMGPIRQTRLRINVCSPDEQLCTGVKFWVIEHSRHRQGSWPSWAVDI